MIHDFKKVGYHEIPIMNNLPIKQLNITFTLNVTLHFDSIQYLKLFKLIDIIIL